MKVDRTESLDVIIFYPFFLICSLRTHLTLSVFTAIFDRVLENRDQGRVVQARLS